MRSLTLALFLLAACSGDDPQKDDTGAKDDTDADDTGGGNGGVKPTIVGMETFDCSKWQSAGDTWSFSVNVDDPQGADTVVSGDVAVLSGDGGELASYVLTCGSGQCFGSFRASYDGIGCSLDGEVVLRFVIADEEGNESDPWDYDTAAN